MRRKEKNEMLKRAADTLDELLAIVGPDLKPELVANAVVLLQQIDAGFSIDVSKRRVMGLLRDGKIVLERVVERS